MKFFVVLALTRLMHVAHGGGGGTQKPVEAGDINVDESNYKGLIPKVIGGSYYSSKTALESEELSKWSSGNALTEGRSLSSRIIGGSVAPKGKYEYFASIEFTTADGSKNGCGGSLISEDMVLTAAHCFDVAAEIVSGAVWVGAQSRTSGFQDEGAYERAVIDLFVPVPLPAPVADVNYFPWLTVPDIMVMKLDKPIPSSVRPVSINVDPGWVAANQSLEAFGFGITDPNDTTGTSLPAFLMETQLEAVAFPTCDLQYRGDLSDALHMCAFKEGTGVCSGDSGGPLILRGDGVGTDVQVGINSFVRGGCANPDLPTVHTKLATFADWLQNIICKESNSPPSSCSLEEQVSASPSEAPSSPAPGTTHKRVCIYDADGARSCQCRFGYSATRFVDDLPICEPADECSQGACDFAGASCEDKFPDEGYYACRCNEKDGWFPGEEFNQFGPLSCRYENPCHAGQDPCLSFQNTECLYLGQPFQFECRCIDRYELDGNSTCIALPTEIPSAEPTNRPSLRPSRRPSPSPTVLAPSPNPTTPPVQVPISTSAPFASQQSPWPNTTPTPVVTISPAPLLRPTPTPTNRPSIKPVSSPLPEPPAAHPTAAVPTGETGIQFICDWLGFASKTDCLATTEYSPADVTLGSSTIPSQIGLMTHFTRLHLYNKGLEGSMPADLGKLTKLTSLMFFGNSLTGAIPSQVGELTALTTLNLGANKIGGTIPKEVASQLTNLKEFMLYSNQLTGSLPSEIGEMSDLKWLHVSRNNNLSGSLPSEIGKLSKLRYVYLFTNRFTGEVPSEIKNLVNAKHLWLNGNRLSGTIPSSLCSFVTPEIDCPEIDCECCTDSAGVPCNPVTPAPVVSPPATPPPPAEAFPDPCDETEAFLAKSDKELCDFGLVNTYGEGCRVKGRFTAGQTECAAYAGPPYHCYGLDTPPNDPPYFCSDNGVMISRVSARIRDTIDLCCGTL